MSPNATVRQGFDRVVGEGRAEEVATDPLKSSAVAAVDGRGRVQVQAIGGDRVGRLGVGRDGCEVRASQRVLDASGEREVEVEVVGVVTLRSMPPRASEYPAPRRNSQLETLNRDVALVYERIERAC